MNDLLRILWYYGRTRYGRKFRSPDALHTWQDQQVKQFLRQILPRSPFYQAYYRGLNLQDWRQFPLINKSIMMSNFDRLNTVGISQVEAMEVARKAEEDRNFRSTLRGYTVGLSSGTSGNRGLFLVSPAEQQAWAGTILAKALPQSILSHQRIAFFLRANSNLYETVQRQRIQFEYFDLFQPLEQHIVRLNDYHPTLLVAPASMLRFLAEARSRGELSISPNRIISVAEVLDPLDEQVICQAFDQPVHQIYQCTEGFLAATCDRGTLHLNEESLVIQKNYLDRASGRFMPIITDFQRTTQPIIRYRLDDILTEQKTPCPCGSVSTAIAQIEGRCDDIFYLSDRIHARLIPIFPDLIRRAVILTSEAIQEYSVVQTSEAIQISLKVPEDQWTSVTASLETRLKELLERSNCQIPPLEFNRYPTQMLYDKKLRRIRRES
ncbi:MAG TPA: F390 synthetase-related protein [Coleofasciculaceae cyanobacterium]|jgi:putative adenylate-forming enzyme